MNLVVCIDPGHGGWDPGALGPSGARECDVALSVGLLLKGLLEEVGATVVMTREQDKDLASTKVADLEFRSRISNGANADIFVSIHCNAAENRQATGFEVWTYPGWSEADELATRIWRAMREWFPLMKPRLDLSDGDVDREAKFAVLRDTEAPAVLVELGFISNKKEEAILESPIQQMLFASSIADGIARYNAWWEAQR